ncbi:MAG: AI-2E family transporter [Bacilli bacterium]|nr:AI-2E family transporter [Bacilli bacterium]
MEEDKLKKKNTKKLNTGRVNGLVRTGNKILKILYVLFIILLIYVVSLIFKEWKILSFIGKILGIMSPLFIGWFIAWLLNPLVKRLQNKGMKRISSVVVVYLALVLIITLILVFTIPSLGTQISDIVASVPKIMNDIKEWIDNIFIKLSNLSLQNLDSIKASFLTRIDSMSVGIQTSLPTTAMKIISGLISGVGTIALSLILGFYILFDFDKFSSGFVELFPKNLEDEVQRLMGLLNDSLYSFISGTLWLSLLLFIVSVIGFSIIGLNAPVLVAFVCVVTNLIPYIGPYLGAAVAGAIGFSQSSLIGILTLIFILVIQTIEGNVLQPLVMSKKMNLSPITIIISLLVFEYLFGIFGMVIATPVVALLKIIYNFFDEKYNFFGYKDKEE